MVTGSPSGPPLGVVFSRRLGPLNFAALSSKGSVGPNLSKDLDWFLRAYIRKGARSGLVSKSATDSYHLYHGF